MVRNIRFHLWISLLKYGGNTVREIESRDKSQDSIKWQDARNKICSSIQ
jgi:hypothetical protein